MLSLVWRCMLEKAYWLGRKRASLKMARNATSAQARLTHYDLAGRYGLKAVSDETVARDLARALPPAINENDTPFLENSDDA